jgi:isomerase DpgB
MVTTNSRKGGTVPSVDDVPGITDVRLTIDSTGALSSALIAAMNQMCDDVEDAGGNSVVVLHLGSAADAGATVSWPGEPDIHLVTRWERALRRMERLTAVTIAAVHGVCAGPAFEALLAADYRIVARDLRISLPLDSGAGWPGMVIHRLANQLGVAKARHLVLFATEVTAGKAEQIGLVDEVVDDVTATVAARIAELSEMAGTELAIRRRLLLEATSTSFDDALGAHLAACDRTLRTSQAIKQSTLETSSALS